MCHLTGMILGRKRRSRAEVETVRSIFCEVLVSSRSLGPHASGAGWVNRSGAFAVFKEPVTADKLVEKPEFAALLAGIDSATTVILGHARFRTRGDERNNANNHPIVAGVLGTVQGTILNADALFSKFRLKRTAQVDSELLVRLAGITGQSGPIDTQRFLAGVRFCRGQIAGVLVSVRDPETVLILKGESPLEFRWNDKLRAVAYASNGALLDAVLVGLGGWQAFEIPPMTLAVFSAGSVQSPNLENLEFSIERSGARAKRPEKCATCDFERWVPTWKSIPGRTQNGQTE